MEIIIFLLLIVILAVAVGLGSRIGGVETELRAIRLDLKLLKPEQPDPTGKSPIASSSPEPEPELPPEPEPEPLPESAPEPVAAHTSTPPPLPQQLPVREEENPASVSTQEPGKFETAAREVLRKIWNWLVVGEEHRPQNVTMEFAVATTWLIRLGVIILLFGIGFFLKYSIDQGRVLVAAIGGAALIGGGLRLFHGRYGLLGQGLVGAGLATLYLSFFTAHDHGVLGAVPAFTVMILVTAAAGVIAVRYNSMLVAVLGLLGGYGTPLMISSATSSVTVLFSYLLVLGAGVLLMARTKDWRFLHYLAFACTYLLFGRALELSSGNVEFWTFMPFLVGFFILFSTVTFLYQLIHREKATVLELLFLFANAGVFFAFAINLMNSFFPRESIAFVTIGLALFYIAHIFLFLKSHIRDRGLLLSFMGLSSLFLAITLPLILSEGWITVSWAVQGFVMLWIAARMKSEFLRQLAYVLYMIVLARFAVFDLNAEFGSLPENISGGEYLRNLVERLMIFGIPIASFFAAGRLFANETTADSDWIVSEENDIKPWFGQSMLSRFCFWVVVATSFVWVNCEIVHGAGVFYEPILRPSLTLVWIGLAALLLREMLANRETIASVLFGIVSAALVVKVFLFDFVSWNPAHDLVYRSNEFVSGFLMRLIDFGAVTAFLIAVWMIMRSRPGRGKITAVFGYGALIGTFIFSTLEVWTGLSVFAESFRMGGLSIFWSIFALSLLLTGISKNRSVMRGSGLLLMAVVVGKVFFVDLAGLGQLHRIIAFIILGVVVLIGSFIYLKYRHRFLTETIEPAATKEEA